LVYLLCIAAIGIPVMIAEVLIGRAGRTNPIDSMRNLAVSSGRSPAWGMVGMVGVVAGLLIMTFYSVVAGWALDYVARSASGAYAGRDAAAIGAQFQALTGNTGRQLLWHSLFSLL